MDFNFAILLGGFKVKVQNVNISLECGKMFSILRYTPFYKLKQKLISALFVFDIDILS